MPRDLTKTHELFQEAKRYMPKGVNSNFRYWDDENTLVITKGEGAYIWDADGNRYIDYRLAFGPVILGHGFPAVVERVIQALHEGGGVLYAWTTPAEIRVAERMLRMTGMDRLRLTNTGTEATMHALRMARAYTGRERFIKFEGQYHGMHDYVCFSTASSPGEALGSRWNPINAQTSSGIPAHIGSYVINLPFNDCELLEKTVEAHWHEIAAFLVEPLLGNCAGILPRPGYLEKLRELADRYGIVLIFDEVKTGFRIANGGAQQYFGVKADLATYAKAMGNGYPIAAIAGRKGIMDMIEAGGVAHGGTYTGNAIGVAAAEATLELLETQPILESIFARGRTLMDGIHDILNRAGIPNYVSGVPSMFSFILGTDQEPIEYRDYIKGDAHLYEEITMALIDRGALPDSDGKEPWFLSYSHGEKEIADTLTMFEDAVRAVKEG
jgi:glutamate-1-semialdehyde 2,1-aminomutase